LHLLSSLRSRLYPFPLHFHTHPSEWFNRMFSTLIQCSMAQPLCSYSGLLLTICQRRSRFPPYGSGP
jgi:hypothetical protein